VGVNEVYFTRLFLADAFTKWAITFCLEFYHETKSSFVGITPQIIVCAKKICENGL
jgi:hypothetical protein